MLHQPEEFLIFFGNGIWTNVLYLKVLNRTSLLVHFQIIHGRTAYFSFPDNHIVWKH